MRGSRVKDWVTRYPVGPKPDSELGVSSESSVLSAFSANHVAPAVGRRWVLARSHAEYPAGLKPGES